jgi:predicted dehydrogenase
MRVAAIGAGAWGKNIVRALHKIKALYVVAEASADLREALAKEYPELEIVADYADIIHQPEITAVTIATPAPTHHKIATDCLSAGKHTFVEKPLALKSHEAEDLVRLAQEKNLILMVGHLLLYKPAIRFIKGYLASGNLGQIYSFHQERLKLGKARPVENALWSLGVHDVAALLYIAGEAPVTVSSSGHQGLQQGIDDDVYLHMRFKNGSVAHLHNSWLWPEDRRGLKVIGSKGMLVYDEKTETVTLVRKTINESLQNIDGGSEVVFKDSSESQPLADELQHFIDCLTQSSQPLSDGRSGIDVIRVLEQA